MSKKLIGNATNNIAYTGIVRLSQYTKEKKSVVAEIHNEGGLPLFDFLADCLVGNFNAASISRPTKILLLNVDEDRNIAAADNTSFIHLLTVPEKIYSKDEGIVKYSFMIPQEYFAAGNTENATRFNAIGLYADSAEVAEDYAAFCEVNTSGWSISISSVLILDWELHISNKTKSATGGDS